MRARVVRLIIRVAHGKSADSYEMWSSLTAWDATVIETFNKTQTIVAEACTENLDRISSIPGIVDIEIKEIPPAALVDVKPIKKRAA